MTLPKRPPPQGDRVALFVTCMVDLLYPHTGMAVVRLLEHQGLTVAFPMQQTCCGQPGFNGGFREESKPVAAQFLRTFADCETIVVPSGSCTAMIRHEYPLLFAGDPELRALAEQVAARTWEFTEFLVDGLGVSDLGLALPEPQTVALHDSCHGLRVLELGAQARALLQNVQNLTITDLEHHDECCGFGGLFSVKMPDVSSAMLDRKIGYINASAAQTIVVGDVSCLTHMNGGLARQKSPKRVRHIADVLAEGLPQ